MPIFSSLKGSAVLIKIMKYKMILNIKWSPYSFCSIAVESAHQMHYLRFLREDWGQFQHIESHLGKKQPQAKILIASLFRQLHFNNVTGVLCQFLASARFQLIV